MYRTGSSTFHIEGTLRTMYECLLYSCAGDSDTCAENSHSHKHRHRQGCWQWNGETCELFLVVSFFFFNLPDVEAIGSMLALHSRTGSTTIVTCAHACMYRIVPSKRPWALAAHARKIMGGRLLGGAL